jgi:hypothetical protein
MRKYKVNRNQNEPSIPSKEKMAQYKDFSKLSHNYEKLTKRPKRPLYKDPKIFIALVLLVVIVYLIVESDSNKKNDQKEDPLQEESVKDRSAHIDHVGCAMCLPENRGKIK